MNKILCKKTLVVALLLSVLFSANVFVYAQGDTTSNSSQKNEEGKTADPDEVLKTYAQEKGKEYGEMLSGRDYMKGLGGSPGRHFNSRDSVYKYFKITTDSSHNKNIFYNSFIEAFRSTYEAKYIEISMQDKDNNETFWYNVAKKYASIEGEMAAYHDHLNELSEDWERAYNNMVANENLNERFRLFRYSGNLPKNFELDFKSEFKASYRVSYANAIVKDNELNSNYYYVDSMGKTISYDRYFNEMTKTSITNVNMPKVDAIFPERAILERTPMAIRYKQHRNMKSSQNLIPVSDIYELEVQRGEKRVKFHAPVDFIINGYGVRGAGIYKWANNRWNYIYTINDEKLLKSVIEPGLYSNTDFSVFIDEDYVMASDIAFNWAYKEIYTAIRRHNVPQSQKFYPDAKITKLQLADFIYRTMSYRDKNPTNVTLPSDVLNYKYQHEAVKFVLGNGYMSNDANGNFLPGNNVSYDEFERIMQKIYLNTFSMKAFADNMMIKKYHRSDYLTKASTNISRAEVIYAFYNYLD